MFLQEQLLWSLLFLGRTIICYKGVAKGRAKIIALGLVRAMLLDGYMGKSSSPASSASGPTRPSAPAYHDTDDTPVRSCGRVRRLHRLTTVTEVIINSAADNFRPNILGEIYLSLFLTHIVFVKEQITPACDVFGAGQLVTTSTRRG